MKILITSLCFLLLAMASPCLGAEVLNDNFDSYTNMTAVEAVWDGSPTRVSLVSGTEAYGGAGKCLLWSYSPGGTTGDYQLTRSLIAANISDVYIQIKFKIKKNNSSTALAACKFLKLFGVGYGTTSPANYANSTLNLGSDNTFPNLSAVCYGNGDSVTNDTQNKVYFSSSGSTGEDALVVYDTQLGNISLVEGEWYTLEWRAKKNSTGDRSGAYQVYFNGTKYMGVTNVKNKHDDNSALWSFISFGDYSSENADMLLYIDDVVISDSRIGDGGSSPAPPTISNVTISNGRVQ